METAGLLTIPTILHLMVADDTPFPKHNQEVLKSTDTLRELLSLTEKKNTANAIWKPAGLQFRLEDTKTVHYHLKDIGLTPQDIKEDGNEVQLSCDPNSPHGQHVFRSIQDKFKMQDDRALQIFMWARIAVGGGCAMSHPNGQVGSVWLEAQSVSDPAGFRLVAHEIGH